MVHAIYTIIGLIVCVCGILWFNTVFTVYTLGIFVYLFGIFLFPLLYYIGGYFLTKYINTRIDVYGDWWSLYPIYEHGD